MEVLDFSDICLAKAEGEIEDYVFFSEETILSAMGDLRSAITQLSRVAGVAMMRKSDYRAVI